jgi:ribosomal-protein-alanine N-acetyltransferase
MKDIANIADFETKCFCDCKYSFQQLISFFKNNTYKIFGAFDNEVIVGYVIINISDKIDIEKIFVDSNYRKQGIASKFIEMISAEYIGKKIIIEVNENNNTAINFYKKNGFIQISQRKQYYKNGDNALIFEK